MREEERKNSVLILSESPPGQNSPIQSQELEPFRLLPHYAECTSDPFTLFLDSRSKLHTDYLILVYLNL